MKKLAKGELRFIPKKIDKLWRVYDRANGSYPYSSIELGVVTQDVSEADAQAEADRLNGISTPVAPATEEPLPELPDYGISEEDRAKYEEGLFEHNVY